MPNKCSAQAVSRQDERRRPCEARWAQIQLLQHERARQQAKYVETRDRVFRIAIKDTRSLE